MAKVTKHYITKEGLEKLRKELEQLKSERMAEIAERLKEAISYGDLRENSEYEAAKNEQALIQARIAEIEEEIATAEVVTKKHKKSSIVELGSTVTIQHVKEKEKITFTIVGSTEVDPLNNKFSNESPLGEAVMSKQPGDKVVVLAPAGEIEYKILEVE